MELIVTTNVDIMIRERHVKHLSDDQRASLIDELMSNGADEVCDYGDITASYFDSTETAAEMRVKETLDQFMEKANG